jgi:hypothetical protein
MGDLNIRPPACETTLLKGGDRLPPFVDNTRQTVIQSMKIKGMFDFLDVRVAKPKRGCKTNPETLNEQHGFSAWHCSR